MDINRYIHLIPKVVLFVDRQCFPDWTIEKRTIDFHDITFVLKGKADYYVNGVKHTVAAGDMLYIPPGSEREAHTFEDDLMRAISFNFHWEDPHNEVRLPFDTITKNMFTKEIADLVREYKQVWMHKQTFYQIQARALFELIIHRLLCNHYRRVSRQIDARVKKAMAYIDEHYYEPISISQLAKMNDLHAVYFGKLFKQQTGFSYKEYLNRIRINNAEMMLASGETSITEAAELCGFSDVSYFSNLFKALKGYSPSSVIKKY